MPLLCLGSATVSLTTYERSLDLRQRCNRATTSSIRSCYLHYSTSIVCPDMSVNCFRCLLDLVVLVYPSSQTFASKKTSTRRPSVNISQATLFSRTTHQRQDAGIASTISANQREAGYKSLLDNLRSSMSEEQLRANNLAQQKGSSAWLTELPLADEGHVLTKREFYDAIYLHYRWQLKRLQSYSFTVDQALSCLKGGFIHSRRDEIAIYLQLS